MTIVFMVLGGIALFAFGWMMGDINSNCTLKHCYEHEEPEYYEGGE
jgi:hypothetical protein